MTIDLTEIVKAIIALAVAIITYVLIPYLKSKTDEKQYEKIMAVTTTAVKAAEQIFKDTGLGEKKKEYVINYLSLNGYEFDEAEVEAMIESAVYQLKDKI